MPSPFPGMDPYLESVRDWRSIRQNLISLITFALNDLLPEPFLARSEGRSYILPQHELIYPDAIVARAPTDDFASGGVTTVAAPMVSSAPLLFEFSETEVWEPHVHIFNTQSEQAVTVIEVLSPTNKAPESTGRDEYVKKQREFLRAGDTHLLEIDLLRTGAHTVAVPRSAIAAQKPFHYVVCLRRAAPDTRRRFAVWAVTVRERLPLFSVPLLPGFADIELDLQALWDDTYRKGRWDRSVDYSGDSEPPLSPPDAAWADTLLREKGLRRDNIGA